MGSRDARPAVGRVKGLLRQKEALPRPVKITKTCGAQRGNVDFNPLKFGRIQFCPINICFTHKSVDLNISSHKNEHKRLEVKYI